VRGVVDVNVLISAALSARGRSAETLRNNRDGAFEMVVSELLLAELCRALAYPKLRKTVSAEKAAAFVGWVSDHRTLAEDPPHPHRTAGRESSPTRSTLPPRKVVVVGPVVSP
jgi:uncharacterized protein